MSLSMGFRTKSTTAFCTSWLNSANFSAALAPLASASHLQITYIKEEGREAGTKFHLWQQLLFPLCTHLNGASRSTSRSVSACTIEVLAEASSRDHVRAELKGSCYMQFLQEHGENPGRNTLHLL